MTQIEEDDPRIVYMPEAHVTAAKGTTQAFHGAWFSVHPERGLMFYQSQKSRYGNLRGAAPQCNQDKRIAESLTRKLYPWAEVKQFDLVLMPINISDFD